VAVVVMVGAVQRPLVAQAGEPSRQLSESQRQEADQAIRVLQSDASLHDKGVACKRLAVIGAPQAIPVLAALLPDEELGHYARFGLEAIPGPEVDRALRDALGKLQGKLLVGVINSIGQRKDPLALDDLSKRLADPDADVAGAAAAAIGRTGTARSARLIHRALAGAPTGTRAAFGDAGLSCAETLLEQGMPREAAGLYDALRQADLPKRTHVAAARGAILARKTEGLRMLAQLLNEQDEELFGVALRAARELDVDRSMVSRVLVAKLASLPPERQALVIYALADLNDASVLPTIVQAARAGPLEVRLAAIRGLTRLGDPSVIPLLLEVAVQPHEEIARAARDTLAALSGSEVDATILAAIDQTGSAAQRCIVIDTAGRRRIQAAVPKLLAAADDADEHVRVCAIVALGETVGLDELAALTRRIIAPGTPGELTAAQQALKASCLRMPDRDACADRLIGSLPEAPTAAKSFLLELLGSVGGSKALYAVVAHATDPDNEIQDAATRVLGEWMTPDAAPELLKLATTLDSDRFKIRAVRGYIRIIRQLGLPTEEKLAMCRQALAVAQRDEDKKLVLEALERIPSTESLSLVMSQVNSPSLQGQAGSTAVSIAERILKEHPAQVAEAMQQLYDAKLGDDLTGRAQALIEQAKSAAAN
jgi:HEAT repeat protein